MKYRSIALLLGLGEEVLGTYTVTLADYPAADGRFAYCVTGLEPT